VVILSTFEILLQLILCRHFNQENQIISQWVKQTRQQVRYHGQPKNSAQTQNVEIKYTIEKENSTCGLAFYCILYALYNLNVHMLALLLHCTTDKQCAMF
jgi:hypothetical protein